MASKQINCGGIQAIQQDCPHFLPCVCLSQHMYLPERILIPICEEPRSASVPGFVESQSSIKWRWLHCLCSFLFFGRERVTSQKDTRIEMHRLGDFAQQQQHDWWVWWCHYGLLHSSYVLSSELGCFWPLFFLTDKKQCCTYL